MSKYECKLQRLGWLKGMSKQTRILGRVITLTTDGIEIEADPALIEDAISSLSLESANPVATPGAKSDHFGKGDAEELKQRRAQGEGRRTSGDGIASEGCCDRGIPNVVADGDGEDLYFNGVGEEAEPLDESRKARFVSVAALLNYVAPDRPAIQWG